MAETVEPTFPNLNPEFLELRVYTQERDFDFVDASGVLVAVPVNVTYPGNVITAQQMNIAIGRGTIQFSFGSKNIGLAWSDLVTKLGLT